MKKLTLLILFSVLGCSKHSNFKQVNWQGEGELPSVSIKSSQNAYSFKNKSETLQIQKQYVNGVLIENSFIKKITHQNSEDKKLIVPKNYKYTKQFRNYFVAQYVDQIPNKLSSEVLELKNKDLNLVMEKIYKFKPELKQQVLIEKPELKIININNRLTPVFRINFYENTETLISYVLDKNLDFLFREEIGSHFATIKAVAYPEGPKLTNLSTVILNSMNMLENLSSNQIQVSSESQQKIQPADTLNFDISDERFDQVQIFYYLQKSISWLEQNLNLEKNQINVKAVAHIGYPEKTNAAFYYNGSIRFGAGDDIVYSRISLDPSIVMHESVHSVIDIIAALPFQGEGGSINEGLADFLTCVQLNTPRLGEVAYKKAPFKRQIETLVTLSQKNGGLYHDSAIVSSLLWNLKEKVGLDKALVVTRLILNKLSPSSDLEQFKIVVQSILSTEFQGEENKKVMDLYDQWIK